jgi:hypothetical protein
MVIGAWTSSAEGAPIGRGIGTLFTITMGSGVEISSYSGIKGIVIGIGTSFSTQTPISNLKSAGLIALFST